MRNKRICYYRLKIICYLLTIVAFSIFISGCGSSKVPTTQQYTGDSVVIDSLGNEVVLQPQARVISLYGSFAECFLLAGGDLVGVTEDAVEERGLELTDDVMVVGSVKDPSLEEIIMLEPDYVILSADLESHQQIETNLKESGIAYGFYRVDNFDDYDAMMKEFCDYTDRSDLYEKHVTEIRENINKIKERVSEKLTNHPKVLLIRAFSTGLKAKGDDNLAGMILKEYGCENIVDQYPSLLEDFSVEEVIKEDPEYIFVLTMGEEETALDYLDQTLKANKAWNGVQAVKEDHFVVLPKELFHYKPNNRWDESYEFIEKVLFDQMVTD